MKTIEGFTLTITVVMLAVFSPKAQAATSFPMFSVSHGAQGTGNYKGKRDKHEKPGPMSEKKRKKVDWTPKR